MSVVGLAGNSGLPARPGPRPVERPADASLSAGAGRPDLALLATGQLTESAEALLAIQRAAPRWTTWHPDVSFVAAPEQLREGSRFEWVWRGTRLRSEVVELEAPRCLAWRSAGALGHSDQRWTFEARPGGTLVSVRMRWWSPGGALPAMWRLEESFRRAADRWMDGLARAAAPAIGAGDRS